MARNLARSLARKLNRGETGTSGDTPSEGGDKEHLNRREYLALGGVAATAALGVGSGIADASSSTGSTFTTDFSEYAL